MISIGLSLIPSGDETIDGAENTARFLQKRKGQRLASDDILLAAHGAKYAPSARTLLDLGTGKGSVAIMLLRARPTLRAVGIEAYSPSFQLAVRNSHLNQLQHRFTPFLGDLRALPGLFSDTTFELITGAPPFIRPGHGVMPANEQRQFGRFELKGGVEAYCETAAAFLNPKVGKFVLLMDGHNESRTCRAFEAAQLSIEALINVNPRPQLKPIYQIFIGSYIERTTQTYNLTMRNPTGSEWSDAYTDLRQTLGL